MSNETMTAAEAHATVQTAATPRPEVRDFRAATIGQVARQGDVYLHRVSDVHGHGPETRNRQLALGTTQGSRHVVEGDVTVYEGRTLPDWCEAGTFLGPCLVVGESGAVVTHPEHAHVALGPGCYQVTHQMDAATRQRVAD